MNVCLGCKNEHKPKFHQITGNYESRDSSIIKPHFSNLKWYNLQKSQTWKLIWKLNNLLQLKTFFWKSKSPDEMSCKIVFTFSLLPAVKSCDCAQCHFYLFLLTISNNQFQNCESEFWEIWRTRIELTSLVCLFVIAFCS